YYLRENLKLRLLSARIALLSRSDATFQADLAAADSWITQYFDMRAKSVQTLHSAVKQLAASPMPGEVPDLNRSLEALRVLRLAQERTPARGPARATAGRQARGRAYPVLVPPAGRRGGGGRDRVQPHERLCAVRRAAVSRRAFAEPAVRVAVRRLLLRLRAAADRQAHGQP